jgi:hypothetical protein
MRDEHAAIQSKQVSDMATLHDSAVSPNVAIAQSGLLALTAHNLQAGATPRFHSSEDAKSISRTALS